MTELALYRNFHAKVRERSNKDFQRAYARAAEETLATMIHNTPRKPCLAEHLTEIYRGKSRDSTFLVLKYLGRSGEHDYYFDSQYKSPVGTNSRIFVAAVRARGVPRVQAIPQEELTPSFMEKILLAIKQEWRKKERPLRIARGYYPYSYFINWYSNKGGRRKFYTVIREGVVRANSIKGAGRELKKQLHTNHESADSMRVLTSSGYKYLETRIDGETIYRFTPEFHARGSVDFVPRK